MTMMVVMMMMMMMMMTMMMMMMMILLVIIIIKFFANLVHDTVNFDKHFAKTTHQNFKIPR